MLMKRLNLERFIRLGEHKGNPGWLRVVGSLDIPEGGRP